MQVETAGGGGDPCRRACTPASFPEAPRGEQNWPRPPSNHHTLGWEPPSPAPHASRRQSSGREAEAAAAGGPTQLPRALLPWGHCAPRCPQPDLGRPFAPGTTTGRVRWRPGPVGGACGLTPAQQWERSRAVRPWAGPSQPEKTCQTPALPAPNQTGRGPLAPAPRVRRKAYLTASSLLFCRMSSMNSWIDLPIEIHRSAHTLNGGDWKKTYYDVNTGRRCTVIFFFITWTTFL